MLEFDLSVGSTTAENFLAVMTYARHGAVRMGEQLCVRGVPDSILCAATVMRQKCIMCDWHDVYVKYYVSSLQQRSSQGHVNRARL